MRVGFIGSGNMAAAMARGWAAGDDGPDEMLFTDAGSGAAAALAQEVGGRAAASNRELATEADIVILACKPNQLKEVAAQINGAAGAIVSLLGATSLQRLGEAFPEARLMRVMPNVAVEARRGVLCHVAAEGAAELEAQVVALLGPLGEMVAIDERLMDPATAVMGCSPAYIALVAEALAEAGVHEGLDDSLAHDLVVETLAGTAEMLRRHDALSVRRAVTSPGGSTAAGLAALERGGARAAFAEAVHASVERMRA